MGRICWLLSLYPFSAAMHPRVAIGRERHQGHLASRVDARINLKYQWLKNESLRVLNQMIARADHPDTVAKASGKTPVVAYSHC